MSAAPPAATEAGHPHAGCGLSGPSCLEELLVQSEHFVGFHKTASDVVAQHEVGQFLAVDETDPCVQFGSGFPGPPG